MSDQNQQQDLYFIRHGESTKNAAAHQYRVQRNIPFDWKVFMQDPYFLKNIIFSHEHIDCHLSEKGTNQCFEARELFKDLQPDLILVSPLQRALETCSLIFPDRKVPCIVEPLLSETFKHSSDICRSIELKKKQFPSFDFSPVQAEGEFWYIKNDSPQNQARYFSALKEVQSEYYHEKARSIMEFMHRERIGEKPLNVRLRAQRIKERLRHYRQQYKKIVIVSHFFTIRYLCSRQFINDEPVEGLVMKNCGVHPTSLEEISKYA